MTKGTATPKQLTRNASRVEVLRVFQSEPEISRTGLTERVSVSRGTVSGVVAEMLRARVLEEVGEDKSTGGRRPIRLRYRPESRHAVGVVLFDNTVQAVLTNLDGRPLRSIEVETRGPTPEHMLEAMGEAVLQILEGAERDKVLGVGVGTPGIVDPNTGSIEMSVSKGWLSSRIAVKSHLENRLGLPVHVSNRSRVSALGELRVGVGQGLSNVVYLFLGQGIVAGIVIDGRLYMGSSFSAGEIGHVSLFPDGPVCSCGNRGCLEVYATEAAIVARARAVARENPPGPLQQAVDGSLEVLTFSQVIDAARQGDTAALQTMTATGTVVGMAVAILINLFNPEMVIIGGPTGSSAGRLLLDPVVQEARRRALPRPLVKSRIVSGTLGAWAEAIGAAVLAINQTPIDALLRG